MKKLIMVIILVTAIGQKIEASDIKSLKESAIKGNTSAITSLYDLTNDGEKEYENWWNWDKNTKKEYIDAIIEVASYGIDKIFEKIESMYKNRKAYFKKTSDGEEAFIYWKKTLLKTITENTSAEGRTTENLLFNILNSKILYPIVATEWKNNIRNSLIKICKEKKSVKSANYLMNLYFEYPKDTKDKNISENIKEILEAIRAVDDENLINEILEKTKNSKFECYDIMYRTLKPEEAARNDKAIEEEKEKLAKLKLEEEQKQKELESAIFNKLHDSSLNHNYYPIKEENEWVYNVGDGTQTVMKITKIKFETESMLVDVCAYDVIDGFKKEDNYYTYKMKVDKLTKFDENGEEKVILYFPLKPNTTKKDNFQTFKVLALRTVIVPAGKFSQCIEVEKRFLTGGWIKQWYAPNVGMIKFITNDNKHGELVDYKIQ